MSGKAHSLEDIGLLNRINWPVWAPAMRLALQSISAFRVATSEQAKPPATQPRGQSLKDYTSLCNDYDSKDAKGRTLIRSHVDGNTWFKLKGSATVRAYWNLRYEPGTSVTTFITEVERLGELCNRQNIAFWLQQLNIDRDELDSIYGTVISALGQERSEALREMLLHVDTFAVKTVLMEQLPATYTLAFHEEKNIDVFCEKVRNAYKEDVVMNGANVSPRAEQPASAVSASRQETAQAQATSCNGNCACGN